MMKKVLVIMAIFILAIFIFYQMNEYEESKLIHSVTGTKVTYKVLSQESEQLVVQKEIVIEERRLIVDIGSDRNITRDSDVTLSATLKNIENPDACSYVWREDGEIIGVGSSIERSFSKGEHIVNLQVIDSERREANDTIKVTAWDYYKVKKDHYSASTGEYSYTEWDIFDHNGNYLLMDDGLFSKYSIIYNDEGKQIETKLEYYEYPQNNTKKLYTYDADGNVETIEILNADDVTIGFHTYSYDEDGKQISSKSGTSEDNLTEDEVYVYSDLYLDANSTNSVTNYNENGMLVYSEEDYYYFKEINKYSYDEKGNLIKEIHTLTLGDGNESRINTYDENGNTISSEMLYTDANKTLCHYSTKLTYTKENYVSTRANKVLEGDCSQQILAEYMSYTYDDFGNVIEIKSKLSMDEDSSSEYTTLKTKMYYSNELEE
jgi:hypothetical protein